jgi:hypothetical protein
MRSKCWIAVAISGASLKMGRMVSGSFTGGLRAGCSVFNMLTHGTLDASAICMKTLIVKTNKMSDKQIKALNALGFRVIIKL